MYPPPSAMEARSRHRGRPASPCIPIWPPFRHSRRTRQAKRSWCQDRHRSLSSIHPSAPFRESTCGIPLPRRPMLRRWKVETGKRVCVQSVPRTPGPTFHSLGAHLPRRRAPSLAPTPSACLSVCLSAHLTYTLTRTTGDPAESQSCWVLLWPARHAGSRLPLACNNPPEGACPPRPSSQFSVSIPRVPLLASAGRRAAPSWPSSSWAACAVRQLLTHLCVFRFGCCQSALSLCLCTHSHTDTHPTTHTHTHTLIRGVFADLRLPLRQLRISSRLATRALPKAHPPPALP